MCWTIDFDIFCKECDVQYTSTYETKECGKIEKGLKCDEFFKEDGPRQKRKGYCDACDAAMARDPAKRQKKSR